MKNMRIGDREFAWGARTYVMGVINVTEDSFSGDGLLPAKNPVEAAVAQARRFVADGADLIDVGGESTRPGGEPVSEAEELERVIPVVRALSETVQVPISIDTYKANVARAAVTAGAICVNDVWGGTKDAAMYEAVAKLGTPIILTHNSSSAHRVHRDERLGNRFTGKGSKNIAGEVCRELNGLAEHAQREGVSREHIILDPGFGFGKTVEQNLELLRRLNELTALGYPILAGVSRKSFVGYTLDLPPNERFEGTIAASVLCAERGANIIRAHDVLAVRRTLAFTDAVTKADQE
ncbi:MAG TPA: dihydropteroate synthase [Candidatus Paceibacterota bacterium]|jgi:dihydropteroate synthase|nr:dihydropteroate synthase [Candidatus Paceibacterota bacterium]